VSGASRAELGSIKIHAEEGASPEIIGTVFIFALMALLRLQDDFIRYFGAVHAARDHLDK
jgi:hypothetical protein